MPGIEPGTLCSIIKLVPFLGPVALSQPDLPHMVVLRIKGGEQHAPSSLEESWRKSATKKNKCYVWLWIQCTAYYILRHQVYESLKVTLINMCVYVDPRDDRPRSLKGETLLECDHIHSQLRNGSYL